MDNAMDPTRNIKKIVFFFGFGLLLIILLQQVWHYLHTGTIIVTTNSPNSSITLSKVNNEKTGGTSQILKSNSRLATHVSLGQYVVSVKSNQQSSTQFITLDSRKTLSYEIDPLSLANIEPVVIQNTQDIAVNGNRLVYVNSTLHALNKIDASNNLISLDSSQQFQTIRWASASYGVGQDNNQNLYVINNDTVSQISTPFLSSSTTTSFDIAANGQIFVSSGAGVYMGTQKSGLSKIYTAPSSNLVLGATPNQVAVAYNKTGGMSGASNSWIAIAGAAGQKTEVKVDESVSTLAWSPNSQYIASVSEASINIYDAYLQKVLTIPTDSLVGSLKWLDSNTLLFSVNDKLWIYNLSTQRADLLANLPLGNTVAGLAVNDDKSYVYIAAADTVSASNSTILRIGLLKQPVATYLSQLQDILPMTLSDCTISLVNFAQPPTILITPAAYSGLSSDVYMQEAKTELTQDGFDLSKLQLKLKQSN